MNLPVEQWRSVLGFEGHYEVSNHGRVCSLKHGKRRLRKVSRHNKDGHRFVMLCKNGVRKQFVVARLMLLSFVGPPPSPKHLACHDENGNEHDYLWRLRWDTVCENNRDTVRHGTHRHHRGGCAYSAKLSDLKVADILRRLVRGESQNRIAIRYGVTQETVSRINTGDTWQHVPRPSGLRSVNEARARSLVGFTDDELRDESVRRGLISTGDPRALEMFATSDLQAELAKRQE